MARTGARTDTGRAREGNEDRYLAREERDITLLAVADGVGGASGGEVAADAAIAELGKRFFDTPADRGLSDALAEAVREANAAVISAAGSSGHPEAATTLVAAAVRRDEVVIANLGDSRAYLIRESEVRQLTEDHSGAMHSSITRFLGDPRGVQPDVFVESLRPGDRLLLCSDGLTRHVSPEEIGAAVIGRDVQNAANRLVDLANSRGGEDNVTVVVYAAGSRAPMRRAPGRVLAFGIFAALVLLVVAGSIAVLLAASTAVPAPAPAPATPPTATESASPTPIATPTDTPTPSPSPTATP